MSQFCVPMENPVTAGDIVSAVFNDLDSIYTPLGWHTGFADTRADIYNVLATAGDAGAIVLTWAGDDTAESSGPITRPVVLNILNVIVKQRSVPTAVPKEGIVNAVAGRDSMVQAISALRKRMLAYRFMQNGAYAFDDDQRGPVFSRLRYYGVKPFMAGSIATDAFEMAWKFYSPADTPSMDDSDTSDKIMLDLVNTGSKT